MPTSVDKVAVSVSPVSEFHIFLEEADTRFICITDTLHHTPLKHPQYWYDHLILTYTYVLVLHIKLSGKLSRMNSISEMETRAFSLSKSSLRLSIHRLWYNELVFRAWENRPYKLLRKYPNYLYVFMELGKKIEMYVCDMYGKLKYMYSDINKFRFEMFSQRYKSKTECEQPLSP